MTLTANSAIQRILEQKDRKIIDATTAMRDILAELQDQILRELGKAALNSWDAYYLKSLLASVASQFSIYDAQAKNSLNSSLDEAWGLGLGLVDETTGISTGFHLGSSSLEALKNYSNEYLAHALGDAWKKVQGEITLGVLGGKSPTEVANAIGQNIDGGIFESVAYRAETITKTEMGRIFSDATQQRMNKAAGIVPGLEKQWIHAGHPKQARPAHISANGQHVPVNEPFNIGGVRMMYPHDPNAALAEIINCGCVHVPYHANWQ